MEPYGVVSGDGEFDYFVHAPEENYEENYDPTDEDSAQAYANSLEGGYVFKVEARKLH